MVKLSKIWHGMFLLLAFTQCSAVRAPTINITNSVAAKGDIPTPDQYVLALKMYFSGVKSRAQALLAEAKSCLLALEQSDTVTAQRQYKKMHQIYESIRPIVLTFGHIDPLMNSHASQFLKGEQDGNFVGLHRLEYNLFSKHDEAEALVDIKQIIRQTEDITKRFENDAELDIAKTLQSAGDFMEAILENGLSGDEDRYAYSELWDISGDIEGSKAVVAALQSFLPSDIVTDVNMRFEKMEVILARYKDSAGEFLPYSELKMPDKVALYHLASEQAEVLAQLRSVLNIDVYYYP